MVKYESLTTREKENNPKVRRSLGVLVMLGATTVGCVESDNSSGWGVLDGSSSATSVESPVPKQETYTSHAKVATEAIIRYARKSNNLDLIGVQGGVMSGELVYSRSLSDVMESSVAIVAREQKGDKGDVMRTLEFVAAKGNYGDTPTIGGVLYRINHKTYDDLMKQPDKASFIDAATLHVRGVEPIATGGSLQVPFDEVYVTPEQMWYIDDVYRDAVDDTVAPYHNSGGRYYGDTPSAIAAIKSVEQALE